MSAFTPHSGGGIQQALLAAVFDIAHGEQRTLAIADVQQGGKVVHGIAAAAALDHAHLHAAVAHGEGIAVGYALHHGAGFRQAVDCALDDVVEILFKGDHQFADAGLAADELKPGDVVIVGVAVEGHVDVSDAQVLQHGHHQVGGLVVGGAVDHPYLVLVHQDRRIGAVDVGIHYREQILVFLESVCCIGLGNEVDHMPLRQGHGGQEQQGQQQGRQFFHHFILLFSPWEPIMIVFNKRRFVNSVTGGDKAESHGSMAVAGVDAGITCSFRGCSSAGRRPGSCRAGAPSGGGARCSRAPW